MTDDTRHSPEAQTSETFAELCDLLSAQIACARDGRLVQVERLCVHADDVVTRMGQTGANHSVSDSERICLQQLYDELVLTLQAEQADVEVRLKQLRQVKRVVGAYGGRARS